MEKGKHINTPWKKQKKRTGWGVHDVFNGGRGCYFVLAQAQSKKGFEHQKKNYKNIKNKKKIVQVFLSWI